MLRLLLSFLFVIPVYGQVSGGIVKVNSDPTGSCTVAANLRYNYVAGTLWGCNNGTWAQITGVGSSPTGGAGGDLGGTYPNPSVVGIRTKAIPTLPTDGYLHYSSGVFSWDSPGGAGNVTGSGLTNNQLICGSGGTGIKICNATGDVTTSGSNAFTLATVNANIGSCGDSTHVCQVTLDAKGRVTAATSVLISGGGGGGVTSFNTRTGAVTPQAGDYSSFYEAPLTFSSPLSRTGNTISCPTCGSGGSGDVVGPASATADAVALYNGTTGKLIKNSGITVDASGNLSTPGTISSGVGAGKTGISCLPGKTSGNVCFAAADTAGGPITYVFSGAFNAGEFLKDNGVITCPDVLITSPPTTCHSIVSAPAGGGSSSTLYLTTGNAEGISPGIIAQSTNLPALAAGACMLVEIAYVVRPNANYTLKVWYGTTPGTTGNSLTSNLISGTGTPAADRSIAIICNENGVQNSQQAVFVDQFATPAGTSASGTPEDTGMWSQNTTATNLKVGFEIVTGANFYKVLYFKVSLIQ